MIRILPLTLPLVTPFKTSKGQISKREGLLVRIESDGVVGWGEASPFPGLSTASLDSVRRELMSLDATQPDLPTNIETVQRWVYERVSAPSAAHGLGTALLDCMAQKAGMSFSRFINPDAKSVVPLSHLYTDDDRLFQAIMLGAQTVKIKVGMVSPSDDIQRVKAIRKIVGPDVYLRLDANGAWTESEALCIIDGLLPVGVRCIEDPVHPDNLDAMARLRGRGIGIVADETINSPTALKAVINCGAADAVVIKPMRLGTPLTALAIVQMANQAGLASFVTTTIDGAVGRMTAIHIAAAAPTDDLWACGLNTGSWIESDVGNTPDMTGSHIDTPKLPGLGLSVNA